MKARFGVMTLVLKCRESERERERERGEGTISRVWWCACVPLYFCGSKT